MQKKRKRIGIGILCVPVCVDFFHAMGRRGGERHYIDSKHRQPDSHLMHVSQFFRYKAKTLDRKRNIY